MKKTRAVWIFAVFCLILGLVSAAAADVIWVPVNYSMYDQLVKDVTAVLKGEQPRMYVKEDDFSVLFRMAAEEDLNSFGWLRMDVDGDGTEELLLGQTDPEGNVVFYDMYTIQGDFGIMEHVFDGWDRSRWYLLEDGGLENEGSNSATSSVDYFFQYQDGKLVKTDFVVYDEEENAEAPWSVSALNADDPEEKIAATEEEALAVKEKYVRSNPELTPFVPAEDTAAEDAPAAEALAEDTLVVEEAPAEDAKEK